MSETYKNYKSSAIRYYPNGRTNLIIDTAIHLENLISTTIFRNNLKNTKEPPRIIMSTPGYEFTKRLIQLNIDGDWKTISPNLFRLPFCTYDILNHNFSPIQGANNFALSSVRGFTSSLSSVPLANTNAIKVECDIPVNYYFDRVDDLIQAYEILLSDCLNKHSFQTNYIVKKYTKYIVPIEIQVKDVKFPGDNSEKKWLEDNKILTMRCIYHINSVLITPQKFPDESEGYDEATLPQEELTEEEKKEMYITTKVKLDWYINNQKLSLLSKENKFI